MLRRRPHDDDDAEEPRGPPDRSWSTRLAWLTLVGGAALLVTRMSLATVVQIHGDGMAPTLLDGDSVVVARGAWSVERGDIVVYDPGAAVSGADLMAAGAEGDEPRGEGDDGDEYPDARKESRGDYRNTAVVDPEELEENWEKVQRRSDGIATRRKEPLRLGRVLAVPGDTITFNVEDGALGLAINGSPLWTKPSEPLRIELRGDGDEPAHADKRPMAYESTDERRYPVLSRTTPGLPEWPGLGLPSAADGPVEIEAFGYLVVADNRDDGACCDSRAVGWIPEDAISGKVMIRLASNPSATPDLDPKTRGLLFQP
jgi:signal peptidase I